MSDATDTPSYAQIARLTDELKAHRQDLSLQREQLRQELATLQFKVTELGRAIDGLPVALELARLTRRTESRRDTFEIIGVNAVGLVVGAAIFGISVLLVR